MQKIENLSSGAHFLQETENFISSSLSLLNLPIILYESFTNRSQNDQFPINWLESAMTSIGCTFSFLISDHGMLL